MAFGLYLALCRAALNAAKTALGIFYPDRWSPIIQGLVVISLTIILTPKYALNGVLISTIIGGLVVPAWHRPLIIYKLGFTDTPKHYFVKLIVGIIFTFSCCMIHNAIIEYAGNYFLQSLVIMVCLACFLILNLIFFSQYVEFKVSKSFIADKFNEKSES